MRYQLHPIAWGCAPDVRYNSHGRLSQRVPPEDHPSKMLRGGHWDDIKASNLSIKITVVYKTI